MREPAPRFLVADPARPAALVGMIHVGALPGTPRVARDLTAVIEQAAAEAALLTEAGVQGLILENMHDVPYLLREVGPEIVAGMTAAALAVRRATDLPLGIQILAGANQAALAVAQAAGARFIRAEGFAYASVADEGLFAAADAGPLLRYRRAIGAPDIAILADVRKKHAAHAITDDLDLPTLARGTVFAGADGLILTGTETGAPADPAHLDAVRPVTDRPLLVGSGVTPEAMADLVPRADGLIVGSWYKQEGRWHEPPDPQRVRTLVEAWRDAADAM